MAEDNNTKKIEKEGKDSAPPKPKWLFYILSFIIPILGIVLGIVYLIKKGKENRKFGIRCIIWSCVNILVIIFWKVVFFIFYIPLFYLVHYFTGTLNTL